MHLGYKKQGGGSSPSNENKITSLLKIINLSKEKHPLLYSSPRHHLYSQCFMHKPPWGKWVLAEGSLLLNVYATIQATLTASAHALQQWIRTKHGFADAHWITKGWKACGLLFCDASKTVSTKKQNKKEEVPAEQGKWHTLDDQIDLNILLGMQPGLPPAVSMAGASWVCHGFTTAFANRAYGLGTLQGWLDSRAPGSQFQPSQVLDTGRAGDGHSFQVSEHSSQPACIKSMYFASRTCCRDCDWGFVWKE